MKPAHAGTTKMGAAHASTTTKTAMPRLRGGGKSGCRQNQSGTHRDDFHHDSTPLLVSLLPNAQRSRFDPGS
jgi:hypothetical protein